MNEAADAHNTVLAGRLSRWLQCGSMMQRVVLWCSVEEQSVAQPFVMPRSGVVACPVWQSRAVAHRVYTVYIAVVAAITIVIMQVFALTIYAVEVLCVVCLPRVVPSHSELFRSAAYAGHEVAFCSLTELLA